jgi:hypothetical protein
VVGFLLVLSSNCRFCDTIAKKLQEFMQSKTKQRLLQAYVELQETAAMLYEAVQEATDDGNDFDAILLETRADKIFEKAENINTIISEME